MDNRKKENIFRIVMLIVSVLLSVIVTIVSAWKLSAAYSVETETINLDAINIGISLILGCSTFIIIELVSLIYYSIAYTDEKAEHDKFMANITEYSHMLHDMNLYYYDINKDSHGPNDLFVTYAKKEIEKLNNTLRSAATQKEFSISADYIINATGVFDSFSQTTDKTLKMTFPIFKADNAIFTSAADSHFFEVLQTKVAQQEIKAVNVIIILEDEDLLTKDYIKKLFDYYASAPNYKCKIAILSNFSSVCENNGISSQFVDFGIYGPKMLYLTEQYTPIHKGTYYKDETKVRHYSRLFDEVWESDVITFANPSNNTDIIPIADLIS